MIEIVPRNGPPEAMNCPALICDACRKQVVGGGNILWVRRYVDDKPESSPLMAAHKGQCDQAVEAWLQEHYPTIDGWCPLWEEAADFVRYLANNLAHSFAEDSDGAYLTQTIIAPAR